MLGLTGRYLLLALAVLALNFALPRFLPGDPLDFGAEEGVDPTRLALPAEARARLLAQYRLDRPLTEQFAGYVSDLARGDLGRSIARAAPVGDLVWPRVPWTLALMLSAALVSLALGTALGLAAAWRGGRLDRTIVGLSTGLSALPEVLVSLGLLVALGVWAGLFPLHGGRSQFDAGPFGRQDGWAAVADAAWHLALPVGSLVLATTAGIVLVARGAARAELRRPYLDVARAKGLPERRIVLGHLLPNAALPLVALFGLRLGQVLGGAVAIERVFAVPGLGLLAFEAIRARDYPVLQAVFLLGSLFVLLVQFGLELAYRALPAGAADRG